MKYSYLLQTMIMGLLKRSTSWKQHSLIYISFPCPSALTGQVKEWDVTHTNTHLQVEKHHSYEGPLRSVVYDICVGEPVVWKWEKKTRVRAIDKYQKSQSDSKHTRNMCTRLELSPQTLPAIV